MLLNHNNIKIGLIQTTCHADVRSNLEKTVNSIRQAALQGAQIVCLQELFSSQYFCDTEAYENFNLSETVPGPTTGELQKLAGELQVVIIASLFEKVDAGIHFNTAAVIDADGSYLGRYRKNHIPDDPGFYEKFYFAPGDDGYRVFDTRFGRIGVLICWDQWYPEAARITSLMGAKILFYPTAIGWASAQTDDVNQEQYQAWQTIQRSHAIANGVHVVAVNRTGQEKEMRFWGGSFVSNPFGTVLYQAPHDREDIHVVEIDVKRSDFYRTHWPFMRDRRIDTYKPLLNRYLKP
ncbi:MAG: carbon-nitrogen hydrolase [Bacteroidales bacterium]|nr:carbon-nitrogen hydrolase [Bacteroidales bacterium]